MWNNLFSSVNVLEKGIDATWLRNEVINNNISNADTPGFKTSEVKFEEIMAATIGADGGSMQLKSTNENHITGAAKSISDVEAEIVTDTTTSNGVDENNVDIESEMVALAKNSIEYYTLVSKVNSEFKKLNTAINVS